MSQHSVIEHRANYHFLKIEEDYIAICPGKHSHCKAAILSLLEHWMNSKRTETSNDDDLFIYMSYPQFVKHLFNLYGRSIVIISLDKLEQEGLIVKRPYIDAFNQDTFEYRLNRTAVQAKLNALPELPSRSLMGSSKVNGGRSKINDPSSKVNGGSSKNKRGGRLKVNGGSFKSKRNIDSTQIPTIDSTQINREERNSAHVEMSALASPHVDAARAHKHPRYEYRALPGLSEHPDDQLPGKNDNHALVPVPPVPALTAYENHIQVRRQVGHDGITSVTFEDLISTQPALSENHTHCHFCSEQAELTCRECGKQVCYSEHGRRFPLSETENHDYCLHCLDAHNAEEAPQQALRRKEPAHQQDHGAEPPCSAVVTPDVPPSGVLPRGKGTKKAEEKPAAAGPPQMPPADMPWGTRKCLMWFDYWRGGILIGKFKFMQASTCAKGLAEQFDEQTVIQARTDMEADPYYIAKGGCDVCDVANNIHKYLKKRQNKVVAFKSKQQLIAQTEDLVEWQGRMMTVTEADALGFNGGFGAYL